MLPGDLKLADRGFTVHESVWYYGAQLNIPAFTRGKDQQDSVDVETTRGIANVRIHVERVIRTLRQKYTIIQSTLPTDFLTSNINGPPEKQVPLLDRIVRVCSALVNCVLQSFYLISLKFNSTMPNLINHFRFTDIDIYQNWHTPTCM